MECEPDDSVVEPFEGDRLEVASDRDLRDRAPAVAANVSPRPELSGGNA